MLLCIGGNSNIVFVKLVFKSNWFSAFSLVENCSWKKKLMTTGILIEIVGFGIDIVSEF